jgi:hypothetical protein
MLVNIINEYVTFKSDLNITFASDNILQSVLKNIKLLKLLY